MYDYETQKQKILTDSGQRMFLAIREHTWSLLKNAGAARMQEIMHGAGSGDSWTMLACVDHLVELGEIKELTQKGSVDGHHRVFVGA